MIGVLEWDSGVGLCSLIIQLTNSKDGNGVRDEVFLVVLFLLF